MKTSLLVLLGIVLFFLGASLMLSIAYQKHLNKQKKQHPLPSAIVSASFGGTENSFLLKKPFLKPIVMDPGVADPYPF